MAGAATDGDVLGARGSSANGPMAGSPCLTGYESTRVKTRHTAYPRLPPRDRRACSLRLATSAWRALCSRHCCRPLWDDPLMPAVARSKMRRTRVVRSRRSRAPLHNIFNKHMRNNTHLLAHATWHAQHVQRAADWRGGRRERAARLFNSLQHHRHGLLQRVQYLHQDCTRLRPLPTTCPSQHARRAPRESSSWPAPARAPRPRPCPRPRHSPIAHHIRTRACSHAPDARTQ